MGRMHGYALVAVLWMVSALFVLISAVIYESRAETRAASVRRDTAVAEASGDAAIQLVARLIAGEPKDFTRLRVLTVNFDGKVIRVEVTPVSGLISINSAQEPLLSALFSHAGEMPPNEARRIAQRVIDWRDPDAVAQPEGAENPEYREAGSPYLTRGGPFETTEDLLQVLGMNFDIYDKIKDLITVIGGSARCNPLAAPPGVLLVLAQGNEAVINATIVARDAGNPIINTADFVQEFIDQSSSAFFRVRAFVPAGGGEVYMRTAHIQVAPNDLTSWRILSVERVRAGAD